MNFLTQALEAIPDAAKSPAALVAYLAVVGAWALIAWRVNRNKNLLNHLEKLPEQDRATVLELEMGVVRVDGGLTPEQWLKSRITKYYFLGFLALCAVAVIVFVIAATTHGFDSSSLESSVEALDVGMQKNYIEHNLGFGSPISEEKSASTTHSSYKLPNATVQITYDSDMSSSFVYVLANQYFHPLIYPKYFKAQGETVRLGSKTFSDIPGDDIEPVWFNEGAHVYQYAETHYLSPDSWHRSICLVLDPSAFDHLHEPTTGGGMTQAAMEWLFHLSDNPTNYSGAPSNVKADIETFRETNRPNGFGISFPGDQSSCGFGVAG